VEGSRLGSHNKPEWRVIWLKLLGLYLVRYKYAPTKKQLSWYLCWTFLEHLLYACHYIQLLSLPMRKDAYMKLMHTIIPRNKLLRKGPKMRHSPKALIWGNSLRLNPTNPCCRKLARKSSIQGIGGQKREKTWSQMQYKVGVWFRHKPETSTCGQVSSFLWMDSQKLTDQVTALKVCNSGV
jgi:hypothetical protein